ncbi:MAG: class I SAM-dependent methyltransferase [Cytophagia bacterium]|nr:class I SAM-dependent methyltransferase [Cytophagia bacterium]
MEDKNLDRFRNLRFEDFEKMASDKSLKPFEKVGFPSVFREGYDEEIFMDIKQKTDWNNSNNIIDIGCGCGELAEIIINDSRVQKKRLTMVDSNQVLDQLPNHELLNKVDGQFPSNFYKVKTSGLADIIICYSVFHYIFIESNPIQFIDKILELLKPGGRFLLGDIPNVSKRNRFLSTPAGEEFHQKLKKTKDKPNVVPFSFEEEKIDDGYLIGLIARYRNFGYEVYLLPQSTKLPLANSREDLLFIKSK